MTKMSPIGNRILPYEAGITRLTPLDQNKTPMYERAVSTPYSYLASTQVTVSKTTETVENGNGQPGNFVTDQTYTMTIVDNAYSPIFYGVAAGLIETLHTKALMPTQFTYTLAPTVTEDSTLDIVFGTTDNPVANGHVPAPDKNGNFHIIVNDNKGNVLTKATQAQLGTYVYDEDNKTLSFSEDYKGMTLTITFDYEHENVVEYTSDPILKQPEFLVETFGIVVDAETDDKYLVYRSLERATLTGDLANQPMQKSRSSSITYTFTSAPVPKGVSIYHEKIALYESAAGMAGTIKDNIVNGCDDNFTGNVLGGGKDEDVIEP